MKLNDFILPSILFASATFAQDCHPWPDCGHSPPPAPLALDVSVDPTKIVDKVGPYMYGSGIETYNNCMYGGLWSNMIYDDSFEDASVKAAKSSDKMDATTTASSDIFPLDATTTASSDMFPLDTTTTASWYTYKGECAIARGDKAFNGNQSLSMANGCRAVNRGLVPSKDTEQASSMHFEGGKGYDGYVFITSTGGAKVQVSLLCSKIGDFESEPATLGTAVMTVGSSGSGWTQHNFSITPSADCLQATGQGQGLVALELLSGGPVSVDKLMVEPGAWGRYKGMHIRRDLADAFLGQKPTIMRLGGSMTNADGFRFKYMVGPSWSRPPTDSHWIKHTSWGFGIFEFLTFCELAGIEPVLCINFDEDMAGLLEYLYGDSSSAWGKQRISDGHPKPYIKFPIICSNEEPQQHCGGVFSCYIAKFKAWSNVTKAAAIALDVWPLTLGVSLDSGAGRSFSPDSDDSYRGGGAEMIRAIVDAELGPRVLWDQHGDGGVAAGWGDGRDWAAILSLPANNSMEAVSRRKGQWVQAIMLEENGGGSSQSRALGHVSNSFALQRIGHQVAGLCAAGVFWPAGLGAVNADYQIKYLGDRIVKAPYWYSQLMLSESHQPNIIGGFHKTYDAAMGGGGAVVFTDWMAAVSDDGKTLVLRVENPNSQAVAFNATVTTGSWGVTVNVSTLAASSLSATNDYDRPDEVTPFVSTASFTPFVGSGGALEVAIPPFSFAVHTLVSADSLGAAGRR
jgi:hypothetical protein